MRIIMYQLLKKGRGFLTLALLFSGWNTYAQETFPRNDVKDNRAGLYAFTNATIVTDPQTTLQNATLLVKGSKVEQVGTGLAIPKGYTVIDLKGKFIYPSLIDMYTSYGLPDVERTRGGRGFGGAEQMESTTKGAYNANQAIRAHYNAADEFTINSKTADEMRKVGFGAVLTSRPDGLARGTSAFVTLNEKNDNTALLKQKSAASYSLEKGSSTQTYPTSMMGFIALLRQTYLDAEWFGSQTPRPFADNSLEAWIQNQRMPQLFAATSWMNVLRADKVGDEFGVQYIIKGAGDEYKRINDIKATKASLIIPVNYPEAYDVEDPFDAERVSLSDMKHWELAPANLAALEKNGINFAITTSGLKKTADFLPNLRKAIENGLSETTALKALTITPAQLLKVEDQVGSLKKGMLANFIVTSGKLFDEKTIIHQNWIQGEPYSVKSLDTKNFNGNYSLTVNDQSFNLEVSGEPGSHKAKIKVNDSTSLDANATFGNDVVTLSFKPTKQSTGSIRLSGWSEENGWKGKGQLADGTWITWSGNRTGDLQSKEDAKPAAKDKKEELGKVTYPFGAHGYTALPVAETLLIKNATVWTNEADGILQGTDVLIKDGKILKVGKNLSDPTARSIDGTGKHLTAGIIDEHSHIGAASINDVASNSGMVRIGDNIDAEAINIYRALAGGVVAVQVLHGSANPIGGQSALIKLRWGESPENYKIQGADGFIKFALGENVKRSSNANSIRFPQTRMGVEQVFVDAFTNGKEYEKKWNAYNSIPAKDKALSIKPRRDLADEAMVEILNKKRFISCHSYVQSEINMLMDVAERFNFRINTFTHILEGYKVADKMAQHGVAASTFSDWWNYKWEVRYAIPYNAAIMQRAGVLTAINSDDAEMGRRLNQEAAKSVKYAGMSEEDALKMVTLNPAKILHLDSQMGSIKVGKSADIVLWTDHPLSVYAKPEKTVIDGKVYFDLKKDAQNNMELATDRARLIQKMRNVKKSGGPVQKAESKMQLAFHCDDVLGFEKSEEE